VGDRGEIVLVRGAEAVGGGGTTPLPPLVAVLDTIV